MQVKYLSQLKSVFVKMSFRLDSHGRFKLLVSSKKCCCIMTRDSGCCHDDFQNFHLWNGHAHLFLSINERKNVDARQKLIFPKRILSEKHDVAHGKIAVDDSVKRNIL